MKTKRFTKHLLSQNSYESFTYFKVKYAIVYLQFLHKINLWRKDENFYFVITVS